VSECSPQSLFYLKLLLFPNWPSRTPSPRQKNKQQPYWHFLLNPTLHKFSYSVQVYFNLEQHGQNVNMFSPDSVWIRTEDVQWCSRDRNLRDRDLAQTSRPRPRLCHKSRDRDLEVRDRDSRPHISLMIIKANSTKNAAKNIWNVVKYQDKGVCHCYASINLFWLRKIINCLVR